MSDMDDKTKNETASEATAPEVENKTNVQEEQAEVTDQAAADDKMTDAFSDLQKKYADLNDAHLRLRAEFDNYRKRTLREKTELIKNGGESALTQLLPVVDDFERALQNIRQAEDVKAVGEGVELIYNKFITYLAQQGVQAIEAIGKPFETELFEAIATIPAPEADLKGKVVDCVQTGYLLNEKVIRHAKVVVGE
ncbi:MAG: nucleotide exchange factor GrpE [Parabacteroides sp.]|nr:nucleotide exchange factor GrpE [Parabacteroides distasonis]MCI6876703.1 nucleotide exchange factor GrpE [Parabacteroides sp.]MDD6099738.1 nucleotide exchange factor GrpE [bacterium]MDD6749744.1 nucleotide exchange factor GrpE [bacterium]MDD6767551.1 nucleotide exchange factor GrpE [bacterium]